MLLAALLIFLRLGFFATLENPEPRYTVELFPFLIILAGAGTAAMKLSPKDWFRHHDQNHLGKATIPNCYLSREPSVRRTQSGLRASRRRPGATQQFCESLLGAAWGER